MSPKNVFLGLLIICTPLFAQPPTIVPAGDVHGTWAQAGSPFLVQGNISIPVDSTLTIEPGVMVEFQGHHALYVQGRLLALGTEADTIRFTVNDTTGFGIPDTSLGSWNGIRFIDTPAQNDTSRISYCRLEYAKAVSPVWNLNAGGAICVIAFNKVIISNCLITNNYTSDPQGDGSSGGAIHLASSDIKLVNNTIMYNLSNTGGAVQFHDSNPVFINNTISNNYALYGGGVSAGGTSNPTFTSDRFLNNTAEHNGGGLIFGETSQVVCTNVTFSGNRAVWGGGIGVGGGELEANDCLITGNRSTLWGGGIAGDFATLRINNCTFSRDTSDYGSGGLHADHADVMVRGCEFNENEASFGGGVHAVYSQLQFNLNTFHGNRGNSAGGMHIENSDLNIDSCLFEQNEALQDIGGLYFRADTVDFENIYTVNITNTDFYRNRASSIIAGLLITQSDSGLSLITPRIDQCRFIENTAARITGLRISGAIEDFIISNSIFQGNSATSQNAGGHFRSNCTGRLENCLFAFNSTGASVSVNLDASVELVNCTFAYNISSAYGGLSLRNGGIAFVTNCIFWGNRDRQIGLITAGETETVVIVNHSDIQDGIDSIFVSDSLSIINWGTGNIDTDPLFADTSSADFHLQDSSPCIGTGINCILIENEWRCAPVYDMEGHARPTPEGSSSDMGPYENALGFPTVMTDYKLDLPGQFRIYQNYPNPFNPATTIVYQLPKNSPVNFSVYNLLGQKIAQPVNFWQTAGVHQIELDAREWASGLYYYRIEAGKFCSTRKMLLMK